MKVDHILSRPKYQVADVIIVNGELIRFMIQCKEITLIDWRN